MPETLLGAIWLQFAHAVAYKKEFRACELCEALFEVSLDAARTSACIVPRNVRFGPSESAAAAAQALFAAGITSSEIARRLDSNVETVSGWLAEAARPGLKGRRSKPPKKR